MRNFVALLLLFLLAAAISANAQQTAVVPEPRELPDCSTPDPVLFATLPNGIENLAFDGNGTLFLTAFQAGLYQAFPNGTVEFITKDDRPIPPDTSPIDGPNNFMGVDLGPDGALYVSEGMGIVGPVDARVLRFPVPGQPEFEVYASGFEGANGLAVTPDGVVYLVNGFRTELWRITGPGQWTKHADFVTGNGLVEHPDGRLVMSIVGDPADAVVAFNASTPDKRETLFRFNAGPSGVAGPAGVQTSGAVMTKGVDDLAVLDDGRIVASAHLRLQFLLGTPATGEACVLMNGARAEPTSARVAKGFGEWDGFVFLTDNAGDIHAVDLRPQAPLPPPPSASPPGEQAPGKDSPGAGTVTAAIALAAVACFGRRRNGY